jgi:hypothetical protein
MRLTILLCVFALALTAAPAALAQPPAETCGVGDSLTGADTMPQNIFLSVTGDDFDMSGTGCIELAIDHVTCFVPEFDCTVVAECYDATRTEGVQFAINATQGACDTAPASCLDSSQGSPSSGTISVALTAGTNYCFVCEINSPGDLGLSMSTSAGNCGALPVGLETFGIEE